jgi:DNA invertase Pin-like site-specific DNA recombinase
MKVFYSRVSSTDGSQKADRQLQKIKGFDYVFTDQCSGTIPLYERPNGSQIKKLIDSGKLKHLEVHNIDRIGRNTLDILSVYKELTEKGITVVSRNPHIRNIDENGKPDPFSELLLNLLASLASYEKSLIRERQMEGIAIRKAAKLYRGRVVGTEDTPEKFLRKPRIRKILEYLDSGYTHAEIMKILGCSPSTIQKVKKFREQIEG